MTVVPPTNTAFAGGFLEALKGIPRLVPYLWREGTPLLGLDDFWRGSLSGILRVSRSSSREVRYLFFCSLF